MNLWGALAWNSAQISAKDHGGKKRLRDIIYFDTYMVDITEIPVNVSE